MQNESIAKNYQRSAGHKKDDPLNASDSSLKISKLVSSVQKATSQRELIMLKKTVCISS